MMSAMPYKNGKLHRLLGDRRGNFGMMTAIMLPVMIAGAGVAIDATNMVLYRSQLQEATDAGALAAATALANQTEQTAAETLGKDFTAGQMANYLAGDSTTATAIKANTKVAITPDGTTPTSTGTETSFTVQVSSSYDMPLNGMTHMLSFFSGTSWDSVTLSTSSTSKSSYETKTASNNASGSTSGGGSSTTTGTNTSKTANALSMYFVLDRSGSMDELTDTVNAEQPTKSQTTTSTYTYSCPTKSKPNKTCTGTTTTTTDVPNYYTKMEALKIAAGKLADQLDKADPNMQYVRTGADSFNNVAQTPTPLAWGTGSTSSGVRSYVSKLTSSGTTDSSGAFKAAYDALSAASETSIQNAKNGATLTKTIVFMTDGNNNVANADTTTRTYCDKARTAGIKVYTIALMAPAQGQALLQYCASTSSAYFDAQNAADLVQAFQEIGAAATGTETSSTTPSTPTNNAGAVRLYQ